MAQKMLRVTVKVLNSYEIFIIRFGKMGVHEGKSIVYLINQLFISVEKTPTSSGGE